MIAAILLLVIIVVVIYLWMQKQHTTEPYDFYYTANYPAVHNGGSGVDQMNMPTTTANYIDPSEILPDQKSSGLTFGSLPSDPNIYVHDRHIFAKPKSRRLQDGDTWRGDLYIPPLVTTDQYGGRMFSISSTAPLGLRQGLSNMVMPDYESKIDGQDLTVSVNAQPITM